MIKMNFGVICFIGILCTETIFSCATADSLGFSTSEYYRALGKDDYDTYMYVRQTIYRYRSEDVAIQLQDKSVDFINESRKKLFDEMILGDERLHSSLAYFIDQFLILNPLSRTAGIYERKDDAEMPSEEEMGEIKPETLAILHMSIDLRTMIPMNRILLNATNCTVDAILHEQFDEFLKAVIPAPESAKAITLEYFREKLKQLINFPRWLDLVLNLVNSDDDPYLREEFEQRMIEVKESISMRSTPLYLRIEDNGEIFHQWTRTRASVNVIVGFLQTKKFLALFTRNGVEVENWRTRFIRVVVHQARKSVENWQRLYLMYHDALFGCMSKSDEIEEECMFKVLRENIEEKDLMLAEQIREVEEKNILEHTEL